VSVRARTFLGSAGLAAWLAVVLARSGSDAVLGPPVCWVADRDRGALVGLDRDLFAVARRPWPTPVALEPAGAGRLWVAAALHGMPRGEHRLSLLEPRLGELLALDLPRVIDLATLTGGQAVWLEDRGGSPWLARTGRASGWRAIEAPAGSQCLSAGSGGIAIGARGGRVWRFEGRWTPGPDLGGAVLDLACDGEGGWWALARSRRGMVAVRLGPALEGRARTPLFPSREGVLTVVPPGAPGLGAAWVAAADTARAWCLGPAGEVVAEVPLALRGAAAAAVGGDGAPLFALPGAVVRTTPEGEPLPGQGGFERLVDLVRFDEPTGKAR
jgi:hypothetical protein